MGLNANYRLLIEDNHSTYHIPEYKSYHHPEIFTEEYMMQALADFNQEIRESRNFLSTIYDIEAVNESTAAVNIVNHINTVIARVKMAMVEIMGRINAFIAKIVSSIESKMNSYKDEMEEKFKTHERLALLKKALSAASESDKTIRISNIHPTAELKDSDFPDVSVIGSDLVKMATDTMNNYCTNIVQKDGTNLLDDTELKASESFVNFIEGEKNAMLAKVFDKYKWDPTAITASAKSAAEKAFGSEKKEDKLITIDMYLEACDNLEDADKIVSDMRKLQANTDKNFKKIILEMDTIQQSITHLNKMVDKQYSLKLKEHYYNTTKTIIDRVNRSLNVIQEVVNADYTILTHKAHRVYDIFSITGDSMRVKKTCHRMIAKFININNESATFNGLEETTEFIDNLDEFSTFVVMAEEMLNENEFSGSIMHAINEAEGDQTEAKEDTTTAEQPKQNIAQKAGADILTWLKNLIGKLGEMFNRLKNRWEEMIVKREGKVFWEKNKENIKKLTFTDTKVNQWFNFNLEAFKKSTFIKFDENAEYLKDDNSAQEQILHNILGTNPPAPEDKESFSERVKKAFQGEYINDEHGDGKVLSSIPSFKADEMYNFIDDFCTKGFSGDALGSVADDYKKIDNEFKNVSRQYQQISDRMKSNSTPVEKKEEPQNAAAILMDDDSTFNLAEYFGLMHNEATFVVGQQDAKNSADTVSTNENGARNKELDEMIKRCFNYNTIAVTAKMTAAMAAYKQYMGLIKAVYNGSSKATSEANSTEEKQAE